MLTFADAPTIKRAVERRLGSLIGVEVLGVNVGNGADCIHVSVLLVSGGLQVRSLFDLPPSFDYRHLHDEIDQIAEQVKAAKREYWSRGRPSHVDDVLLTGTGKRGLWRRHG